MKDYILWAFFKAGSAEAFSCIYRTHLESLRHYGRKLTPHTDLVEDHIQDLFIELWNKKERLNGVKSIRYYLMKCLRRKIIKTISKKDRLAIQENFPENVPSSETAVTHDEEANQIAKLLHKHFIHLTRRQQEALYLKFYRDFSTEEMAVHMSLSLKSASNLVSKGIVALREQLNGTMSVNDK